MLMLQALLSERLRLSLRHERKTLSFLALTVGKNGPKLNQPAPDAAALGNPASRGHIVGNQMSLQKLALLLSRFERTNVINQTDLKGLYAFHLDWAPGDSTDGPSLSTALSEQLGLKLESRKAPLDVLVLDRAEKVPAEN